MGWSCRADASKTLEAIEDACFKQSGASNVFSTSDGKYFFELSQKEYDDGAITGAIHKWIPGTTLVQKNGSFRIEGNGRVSRGPKFLKDAAKKVKGA